MEQVVKDLLRKVQQGEETVFDVVKDVSGENPKMQLVVTSKKLNPEPPPVPVKAESPKRVHGFGSIDGFVKYITKYKSDDTVILADPIKQIVQCVLNEKAANGFEVLTYKPIVHPLYSAWKAVLKQQIEVTEFVKFLIQMKRTIVNPTSDSLTLLFSQIKAAKNMTVHKGVGAKTINGIICEIEIMGTGLDKQEAHLPDSILIHVPVFCDSESINVNLDLMLSVDQDNDIFVTMASSDAMTAEIATFEQYVAKLNAIDPEHVTCSLGEVRHQGWDYLRSNNG